MANARVHSPAPRPVSRPAGGEETEQSRLRPGYDLRIASSVTDDTDWVASGWQLNISAGIGREPAMLSILLPRSGGDNGKPNSDFKAL